MGKYSAQQSSRILDAAYEMGIRHFDLARSYGYGEAEAFLGRKFARKDDIKISTKFGILPTRTAKIFSFAKPLVRPFIKEKMPSQLSAEHGGRSIIDNNLLQRSLKKSLRELKVDCVHRLYVHEPFLPEYITEQVYGTLLNLREEKVIGGWGVSGYVDPMLKFAKLDVHERVPLYQISSNIFDYEKIASIDAITESVFSPFHRGLVIKLLKEKGPIGELDLMPNKSEGFFALALLSSLLNKKIVLATKSIEHLKMCVEAVEYGFEMDRQLAIKLVQIIKAGINA